MTTIVEASIGLDMPREEAWGILRDLSIPHQYVPGIIRTEITTKLREGVGASRKVYQSETRTISETVTEWHEGQGFVIRLHQEEEGPPAPFKEASFKYWLDRESGDVNRCRVTIALSYTPRWGFMGQVIDKLLLQKGISTNLQKLVRKMKDFYQEQHRGQNLQPG